MSPLRSDSLKFANISVAFERAEELDLTVSSSGVSSCVRPGDQSGRNSGYTLHTGKA